jgi:hypothetical protein
MGISWLCIFIITRNKNNQFNFFSSMECSVSKSVVIIFSSCKLIMEKHQNFIGIEIKHDQKINGWT